MDRFANIVGPFGEQISFSQTMEPSDTKPVSRKIYIVGAGAIGMSLAVILLHSGRSVTAVRTSTSKQSWGTARIAVQYNEGLPIEAPVEMESLSRLQRVLDGIIVITAKATANRLIASELRQKKAIGPIIVMQNGIGVESPFIDSGFPDIYRCVLYATSQEKEENSFLFRSVTASPIGAVKGDARELRNIVELLNTSRFQFRVEDRIKEETWKKTIMNAVFNSICPLLEVDNGIFCRDQKVADIALEIVREAIEVTKRIGLNFNEKALMEQLLMISQRSDGQLISTLQDLKNGNETEIEFLNLAIARTAEGLIPSVNVSKTKFLGELISIKSKLRVAESNR
jgi:2-dehydropantoate 2-reductase